MKKLLLAIWLGCWALGVSAQEEKLTITKVKKGDEPQVVIDAIKTDFPKSIEKNLSFLPGKLYGENWNVTREGNEDLDVTFYQVEIKQGNREYVAVYDKDGKLLSSKELVHNAQLPKPVTETIKKFSGWHVDTTHELIKYKGKKFSDVYRVKLQKNMEHKIVFVDQQGNIVNTRFAII